MSFGSYSRWARCRGSSVWARSFNAQLSGGGASAHTRTLVAGSMLRACAELSPPSGFPEQRALCLIGTVQGSLSAVPSEEDNEVLAAMIDEVINASNPSTASVV